MCCTNFFQSLFSLLFSFKVSVPGLGRSSGGGNGNPLQYSCLENSMDRGAWWATVHGVAKNQHDWAHVHREMMPWVKRTAVNQPIVVWWRSRRGQASTGQWLGHSLSLSPHPSVLWNSQMFLGFSLSFFPVKWEKTGRVVGIGHFSSPSLMALIHCSRVALVN